MIKNNCLKKAILTTTTIYSVIFNIAFFVVNCNILYWWFVVFNPGTMTLNMILPLIILFLLPIIFFAFSIYTKNVTKISEFFAAVEMPVFTILLFWLVILREVTPFYILIMLTGLTAVTAYSINLYTKKELTTKQNTVLTLALEGPSIIFTYISLLLGFFILPIIIMSITNLLISIISLEILSFLQAMFIEICETLKYLFLLIFTEFWVFLLMISSFILLFSIFAFLFITPISTVVIYIKAFIKKCKELNRPKLCITYAIVYLCLMFVCAFHFSNINVEKYYNLTQNATSYEEMEAAASKILPKQKLLQLSIKDAYVARLRYLFDSHNKILEEFNLEIGMPEWYAKSAQTIFDKVSYPFTYKGEFDNRNSHNHYKELFDEDIQYGLRKEITKSVNSSYFAKQAEASLLDIDAKDVKVAYRNININNTNDEGIYRVDFEEKYINDDIREKEVYYEFSLPNYAIICDLNLGKNLEFQGEIAAKGAARKTYENQVKITKIDPALLEKNGPVQYTLRVFPIPAELIRNNRMHNTPRDFQRIKFSYLTKVNNGKIDLPNFYQSRNAYFTRKTKYTVNLNGKIIKISPDKKQVIINKSYQSEKNIDLNNKKIAFLFDTSYSNKNNWKIYAEKNINKYAANNQFDYYFFNTFLSKKFKNFKNIKQLNFGQTKRYDAYASLNEEYDAVILLTDSSVYDNSKFINPKISAPLYVIHVDKTGVIPPYTTEFTQLIYSTNGSIETDIEEVFEKISNHNKQEIFSNLQYRNNAKINKLLHSKNSISNLTKEKILELSKEAGIVSDYASYIALVNKAQKEELMVNENSNDKFEANLKTGEEQTLKEENINSVPEPQDYIFIALIVFMISVYGLKRRLKWLFFK